MKNFIDESGSFGWSTPGICLFCGVTIGDQAIDSVLERFAAWRRSIIGTRTSRELKGSELSANQLNSFAYKVLDKEPDIWLTVVGVDTSVTSQIVPRKLCEQASVMFATASERMGEFGNKRQQESYRQLSGWARNRSPQNVLWMACLEEAIIQILQHCVARFLGPEQATEFETLNIAIDESFIRREEHVVFWREWLRNHLMSHSTKEGILIPRQWREYDHPFLRQFEIHPGLLNLNKLFVRNTGFFSSAKMAGLQIADICANICYRFYRGEGNFPAYQRLRRRIVGRDGRELTLIRVDERGLHQDDPKNHVTLHDPELWKRLADQRRSGTE
jgi:hypothetical protein